jgi:hypothetical protein
MGTCVDTFMYESQSVTMNIYYIHTPIHTCVDAYYTHTHTHTHTHTQTHVYTYIHVHVYIHVYMYIHVNRRAYMHVDA